MRSRRALRPRIRQGVRQLVIMPDRSALDPHHRRLDPLAMRRSTVKPTRSQRATVPVSDAAVLQPLRTLMSISAPRAAKPLAPKQGAGIKPMTATSGGTGIEHWWTYEERAIPGVGKAMVNVGTGNLVVAATDVDVPEQGIDLTVQRVYNAQSLHDNNGDDGGDPAIFGNRWTNNFDASIVYDPNANTITVYDLNGTACTYTTSQTAPGGWQPCTGEYATLVPTDSSDCTYAWTKPNGTVYWFHTDASGSSCGLPQAKRGRLQQILARNQNNAITFTYSYDSSGQKTSEHITEIDANHSDGDSLVMKFGVIAGTWNELATITLPDNNATLQYSYDSSGNLVEVDKPGTRSAFSLPNNPNGPNPPRGDVPETYAYVKNTYTLQEVCGPRCTASMWQNPNAPTDGGALLFTINSSSLEMTSWQFQGVLNFTPDDGTSAPLQANPPTTWATWYTANFLYGQACGSGPVGTTTMCDSDGHASVWDADGSDRVTSTQSWTGTAWLVTSQTWDSSNNLTSTTDANGNATKYGYDNNTSLGYDCCGNMVEMQLPNPGDIAGGSLLPLSYYSYDSNFNVAAYCDPVYNQSKGNNWDPSPGGKDNLCPVGGKNTTTLTYNTPSIEPFGCLSTVSKPSGYQTDIWYTNQSGGCGSGLPQKVFADQLITNYDGTTRIPTQDFTYDGKGNLQTYDKGQGSGGAAQDSWTLNYNNDNRLIQKTNNDAQFPTWTVTSMSCYYPDGSLFYTETPSQWVNDTKPPCPSIQTMLSGPQTPPQHATAYYYDLDGNQIKVVTHKGCSQSNACPAPQPNSACNSGGTSDIGTTCKYYDGLDRLVETAEPYDTRSMQSGNNPPQKYEFYTFRWMNRYIYDLSQNGATANLHVSDSTNTISGIVAYGNLYKTQEYLAQTTGMLASLNNAQNLSPHGWNDVRGTSFDALDRPVGKYELAYEPPNKTTPVSLNAYDCTGQYGLLCQTSNYLGQTTTYTYDNIAKIKQESFSGPSPLADGPRSYTYDPDGRTVSITAAAMGTLSYTYDYDGNKTSVTEPSGQPAASLICYTYYPDGLREYLAAGLPGTDACGSISSQGHPANGGIRQAQLFRYSYRNDGLLATQQINWNGIQINQAPPTFSWVYTPSGREKTETDPLMGEQVPMPPNYTSNVTMQAKTYSYDQFGRVSDVLLPENFEESSPQYDNDDELIGYTAANPGQTPFTRSMTLDARGEVLQDAGQQPTYSANGTEIGDGNTPGTHVQEAPNGLQFDMRSGMITAFINPFWGQDQGAGLGAGAYVYQYDGAGRQTTATQYPNWPQTTSQSGVYSNFYDGENHITQTGNTLNFCIPNPNGCNFNGLAYAQWGPDGRQRSSVVGGNTFSAHWDGDALLFYSSGPGTNAELYIGKEGTMDLNSASGNFYISDRDQTGEQLTAHGIMASTTLPNWFDSWTLGGFRNIFVNKAGKSYPFNFNTLDGSCGWTDPQHLGGPYYYPCPFYPKFMMQRSDAYSMVGGYVQGARIFDPIGGQWLTPDAYAGNVHDPMSQKPFMWNNNNPVEYEDPSGYCGEDVCVGEVLAGGAIAEGALYGVAAIAGAVGAKQLQTSANNARNAINRVVQSTEHTVFNALFNHSHEDTRLPKEGKPGDAVRGDKKQVRTYGPTGEAQRDIDYGHDDNGAGDPHAHDWTNGERSKARPLTPDERQQHGSTPP